MIERVKRQNIKKLIIMGYNLLRMTILKIVKRKNVMISLIQNLHPSTEIAVGGGTLLLKNSIFTRKNVCFRVEGGILKIGTSFFNQGCCITAMKHIEIGDDCLFGPNVVIVDHDHDYTYVDNQRGNHYITDDVVIGNNVWVGANTVILRGTKIGDGCVIGAGTVIKGELKKNTVVYTQKNQQTRAIKNQKSFLDKELL